MVVKRVSSLVNAGAWFDADTDDAMDDDKDSRMVRWFALIKQRNELIREESYLMYRFVFIC